MRRMTEAEDYAVSRVVGTWEIVDEAPHDWQVRQGRYRDADSLELTARELLLYAVGFVAAVVASAVIPWGFA